MITISFDFRQPQMISGSIPNQLAQVKRYLFNLSEQLNWAFSAVDKKAEETALAAENRQTPATQAEREEQAQSTFGQIKSLIIKSADIVNAYYERINERLEGVYVAQSDFGVYTEQTAQDILRNSTEIEQLFQNVQEIITDIETLSTSMIEVNAHIRSGLLYYDDQGVPIYGLEVGQRNVVNGEEVFNKYARFISDRLSFYDQNGEEVAYISDYILHITNAEFSGSITMGQYRIETSNGLAFKWIGE